MADADIKQLIQDNFGAAAHGYVIAPGFARGDDLQRLLELAHPQGDEQVLDIATGGGHTALAFAPYVREVVATDLTARMLEAAETYARAQGVPNVRFERADAEDLPFPDASFDIITTRIAPHHFPNPRRFVREVARVLRPGGRFLLDDNMAPEDSELDAFMNRSEKWRDPGHVRSYRVSEWCAWIEQAGLIIEAVEPLKFKKSDFMDWTARIHMPEAERDALEAWLLTAPPRCAAFFNIVVEDGRVRSLGRTYSIIVAQAPNVKRGVSSQKSGVRRQGCGIGDSRSAPSQQRVRLALLHPVHAPQCPSINRGNLINPCNLCALADVDVALP